MKKSTSKVRVYVDLFFFALMILVLIPQSTGIPIHEWASFIILMPFIVHLLINWKWIARNSTSILKRKPGNSRFDYFFNWLLYFLMILVTVSGILISEAVLPIFGIEFQPDMFWSKIHDLSATLFMAFLGIHIALHWKWILGSLHKIKFKADAHNLSELKTIIAKRSNQILLLISVSIVLSFSIWLLDSTEWAEGFRSGQDIANGGESKKLPYPWLIYVLPLIKITVLMTIPALITGGVLRIKKAIVKRK